MFNAFLRISFLRLNGAILENVVRKRNKFVFSFDSDGSRPSGVYICSRNFSSLVK